MQYARHCVIRRCTSRDWGLGPFLLAIDTVINPARATQREHRMANTFAKLYKLSGKQVYIYYVQLERKLGAILWNTLFL